MEYFITVLRRSLLTLSFRLSLLLRNEWICICLRLNRTDVGVPLARSVSQAYERLGGM